MFLTSSKEHSTYIYSNFNIIFRATCGLPETFPVATAKILHPIEPLYSGQTEIISYQIKVNELLKTIPLKIDPANRNLKTGWTVQWLPSLSQPGYQVIP